VANCRFVRSGDVHGAAHDYRPAASLRRAVRENLQT
jgi:hypothetical protein